MDGRRLPKGAVSLSQLPSLVAESHFPPCMTLMYERTVAEHHAKHMGRNQLTLFFKARPRCSSPGAAAAAADPVCGAPPLPLPARSCRGSGLAPSAHGMAVGAALPAGHWSVHGGGHGILEAGLCTTVGEVVGGGGL